MTLAPTRAHLRVEAPPPGLSGSDTLRALAYGLRGLGDQLATVALFAAPHAPEAGLRVYSKRRHGRAPHRLEIYLPPGNGSKWRRRGLVVRAASAATAILLGASEDHGEIIGKSTAAGLEDIWPILTDIPLADLPDTSGKVAAQCFEGWLSSVGMGDATLLEIERKHRIGRAVTSRAKNGLLGLAAIHRWSQKGGYGKDFEDYVEDFWPIKENK